MIEYLINKLFSINMKDSGKYSYSLKKIREKEIILYHFIKVKFSVICFRLIRNKKYVCFSGAGVIIESKHLMLSVCLLFIVLFSSPVFAYVNSCCSYLQIPDIKHYIDTRAAAIF